MNLDINIYDYISEEEIKEEIREQIKDYIQKICENDKEIKKMIIRTMFDEIRNIQIDNTLKAAVQEKFNSVISEYYLNTSNHSLVYDAGITDKIKELLDGSLSQFTPILMKKLEKDVREYKIDDCLIEDIVYDLFIEDKKCTDTLKGALSEKLYKLIKKL